VALREVFFDPQALKKHLRSATAALAVDVDLHYVAIRWGKIKVQP